MDVTLFNQLINNFSYLGVFVSGIITSASILIPLPSQLPVFLAVVLKLNPILTSALAAAGSMIGEMTGYGIGLAGGKAVDRIFKKNKRLVATIKHYYHRYAFWVILATAFLFFPFDIVGIMSGLSKYDVRKFLLAGIIGKFFKTLLVFYLILNGIRLFGFTGHFAGL
jgi:membrane protein YqaA with SNARE-associated domain